MKITERGAGLGERGYGAAVAGKEEIEQLARLIRYFVLVSTTEAGSGHPTSSLSAADLMTALLFGGTFRYDADKPDFPNNDRLIFSKGHASPLLYSLWAAAGKVPERDLMKLRTMGSLLEGHPTPEFRYAEAATGSLGQGLSIGVGMALNAKYLDKLPYRTYVLLGDSEMSEGSQWEAIQLAAHYGLNNLIGIIDVNGLGQRGETMYGHEVGAYEERIGAFGWDTLVIDGHDIEEILDAYGRAAMSSEKPVMIIAKTVKGKGVSFLEGKGGWHGKALDREQLDRALRELGEVKREIRGTIARPEELHPERRGPQKTEEISYDPGKGVATRMAYGKALKRLFPEFPDMVVLDAEVGNSTYADIFKEAYPERFFEMYIAEQNMAGVALGLSCRGKVPFLSTFAAFFTRAFDQIRMSRYSRANVKCVGSHAGVSIGQDGPSQMGLEDIALFRSIQECVVFYPSDAMATERMVEEAARHRGMVYIRTTREKTPVLYDSSEEFPIGGSKMLRQSGEDRVAVVTAGITLFEALAAYGELEKEGIPIRVIDLYCIKPIGKELLKESLGKIHAVITVEDHHPEGGLGEAVRSALAGERIPVYSLAVRKIPKSGTPEELLGYEEIAKDAIMKKVREVI
ncbi:MAG: transketolase [Alphaproteobacteria bacterium]|uniref:Transketolase n=1 Tax=Candidatus Nitrobium versatile TaxID=2884831 RepID=A0A953M1D1_9BACT|nr:transketolase [Candidatus Nitrobium versatile]